MANSPTSVPDPRTIAAPTGGIVLSFRFSMDEAYITVKRPKRVANKVNERRKGILIGRRGVGVLKFLLGKNL